MELLEERLRKFFMYWLDLASRKAEKETTFDGNIIIVIEGIDSLEEQDSSHKEAHPKFWLPKVLPDRVRVIVTADAQSKANRYLTKIHCQKISIGLEKNVISSVIEKYQNRESFVSNDHKERIFAILNRMKEREEAQGTELNTFFTKAYLSVFCPYPSGLITFEQLPQEKVMALFFGFDYAKLEGNQQLGLIAKG